MKTKHVPLRMCTGCGEMKPKKELVRIVHTKEGEIKVDLTGKLSGRGAYLCHSKACLSKAIKAKRLEKAFSTQIPEDVYKSLEDEFGKA